MNQIKQKIEEIGLSQREISKRLGKNASYLAGVFRSGLSTAKQAELLELLNTVGDGGTVQSDNEIIADLSQKLADCQDGNRQLRAESDKYFGEMQILNTELCRVNKQNNELCGDYQNIEIQLVKSKHDFEMMAAFFEKCKKERWDYEQKYKFVVNFNYVLCVIILVMVILWSVV